VDTFDSDTKRRFDDLIPWYITGQLQEVDRIWVEKMAAEYTALGAELEWHRKLHRDLQSKYAGVREDVGLDRLMARVREERRPAPSSGFAERVRDFFASLSARPAYALGAAVIAVQAGIIGVLVTKGTGAPEYTETRAIAPQPGFEAPVLQVTFKAEATQRSMNLLLVRVGGRVVDGPTQIGEYLVEVPRTRIELAKKEMENSGLVDAVTVLDRRPGRE
jgi:hypothetical protein